MATDTLPLSSAKENEFEMGQTLTIVGGHFVHDLYTAFVAPLLPRLIEKLSLSLVQAGSLSAVLQAGGLLNPFIGYMADKVSLRYFVILAPAVTGTLISSLGFVDSYPALLVLLLITGVSVAAFHAPAPAMIAEVSHKRVGLGMSLFMAGGELGRTLGPLLAVWAVSTWTLDGFFRIAVIGWATSLVLFVRLYRLKTARAKSGSLREVLPLLRTLFVPLIFITLFRNFLMTALTVYLPTFMEQQGASLWVAGASLSILEIAGVAGALTSGTLSDRLGRATILLFTTLVSAALMVVFLNVQGWMLVPVLLALGFTSLSNSPVLLAVVQENVPNNRAVGNGLFMFIQFSTQLVSVLAIGAIGDRFGLHWAYLASAGIVLLAIPAILALPRTKA